MYFPVLQAKRSSVKKDPSSAKQCDDSKPPDHVTDPDETSSKDTEHTSASIVRQRSSSDKAEVRRVSRRKRERMNAVSAPQTPDGAGVNRSDAEHTAVL